MVTQLDLLNIKELMQQESSAVRKEFTALESKISVVHLSLLRWILTLTLAQIGGIAALVKLL